MLSSVFRDMRLVLKHTPRSEIEKQEELERSRIKKQFGGGDRE